MTRSIDATGWSRRAVLGGLGAGLGAGAGMLAVGGAAHAEGSVMGGDLTSSSSGAGLPMAATALVPSLRYLVTCGHDLVPYDNGGYDTYDGKFRFLAPYNTPFASVRTNLPIGAVIKEIEMYGTRTVGGTISLDLWKSEVATGAVTRTAQAIVPNLAGLFTVTAVANDTQDQQFKSTPFAYIDATAAPTAQIYGIRIGYTSPNGFVPLPSGVLPRVYDTRLPGGSKLNPNEERTITLPVPAAIGAAVLTVTLSNTESGGGYVAVFPAGITWPGNSSVNFSGPNQDVANTVVTAVSADSKITIRGGANKTDVIIDVTGWIA